MSPSRIIHEDENCRVVHQPGRTCFTVITLSGLGQRPNGDWFWEKRSLSDLNFDSIGIVAKANDYFPRTAMAKLVPVINAHSQATRIGYAHSMGAYGVLKHGRLFGLTHVLALSPLNYRITSAIIRRTVWNPSFCPERNQGLFISCSETAPINLQVVDPFFSLDIEQAGLFSSVGGIRTIRTPFTDHATDHLLRGTDDLKNTIDFLLKQDFDSISDLLNKIRRSAPERASNLASASLARGNPTRASKLLQKAVSNGVNNQTIEDVRIKGLIEYGRRHLASRFETEISDTERFILKISLEAPNILRLQRGLGFWCMKYSAPRAALGPLFRAVRLAPGDIRCWRAMRGALVATGLQFAKKRWENLTKLSGIAVRTVKLESPLEKL
jgi:hypothetical protein